MNWILENTQTSTIIAIFAIIAFFAIAIILMASGETPEAAELQGAPETLGDFPPFSKEEIERLRELGQRDMQAIKENEK